MFTPSVVLAFLPAPIVRMDDYAGRRRIGVVFMDMPQSPSSLQTIRADALSEEKPNSVSVATGMTASFVVMFTIRRFPHRFDVQTGSRRSDAKAAF
jgi:hypothetical protein